jgi:hypothetical protein
VVSIRAIFTGYLLSDSVNIGLTHAHLISEVCPHQGLCSVAPAAVFDSGEVTRNRRDSAMPFSIKGSYDAAGLESLRAAGNYGNAKNLIGIQPNAVYRQ